MASGISVIVCCFNSEKRLPETLGYLLNQKSQVFDWEIIVVDNNSTDSTAATAQKILSSNLVSEKFKVTTEGQIGLSKARKKGFQIAQYDYLLFCDDDNWLDENYLQLAFNLMRENDSIGILGGKGEAVFEKNKPFWFDRYKTNFAVGEQAQTKSEISLVETVYGAGFIIRKEIFEKLDVLEFQSLLSDRKGNELMSGGDTELCYVAKYLGYEIAYSSQLRFKHLMTDNRMTWAYLKKLHLGFGKMRLYTHAYKWFDHTNELPGKNLRLPLWLDRYLHLLKELRNFLPEVFFYSNEEGNDLTLKFEALRGELEELRTLRSNYVEIFQKILVFKKQIEKFNSQTHQ